MKHLVIKDFRDKFSKTYYAIGNLFESSDSERVAFLMDNGFLEKSKVEKRKTKRQKPNEVE